jgi:hypothetical protein
MSQNNFQVRELNLTPDVDKVPEDAEVVVVANPRRGLPERAVKALTEYMNPKGAKRKGKMIVLADVNLAPDGRTMAPSGLEGLLASFNVRVPDERILAAKRDPTLVQVMPNVEDQEQFGRFFRSDRGVVRWVFDDARPVEALGTGGRFRVAPLLYVELLWRTWRETDLRDPNVVVRDLVSVQGEEEGAARAVKSPPPVAVSVWETGNVPRDAAHAGVAAGNDEHRMVVFGDTDWVLDEALAGPLKQNNIALFATALNWLRGKQSLGEQPGTEREEFTLAKVRTPEMVSRLRFVPIALMLVSIIALGGGIWVVRRR